MSVNILMILTCMVFGGLLRVSGKFARNTPQVLNSFVIYISLPAMVLVQVALLLEQTRLDWSMMIPVSMAWILFFCSFLFFSFFAKFFNWPKRLTGALILTAGLANTSFVGYPFLQSLYGDEGMRVGVIVDQAGSFLVLSTAAIFVATLFSETSKKVSFKHMSGSILRFPPFLALIGAFLWHKSGTFGPGALLLIAQKFSATLIPIALVSVGFQLIISWHILKRNWKNLSLGLLFKLFLAPAFFFLLYAIVFGSRSFSTHITLLQSAMAPMITAGVVAEEFGLDTELSALMVGIGIPLSLMTVLLWNSFFVNFF